MIIKSPSQKNHPLIQLGAAKKAPSQKDYPASLVKYRRTWERMGSGGLRGPQNRCEACKTSWMCSIHIRSRHTLPALLCSRSCCVPQRRCFVFARAFRSAAISAAVFSFVHRVSSMPMEVFCRMTTVRRADLSCVVQAGGMPFLFGREE